MTRFRSRLIAATCGSLLMMAIPAVAQEPALTKAQEDAVRALVRETLINNPEILTEAIDVLRQRQKLAETQAQRQILNQYRDEIFRDPRDPVLGNPDGAVTLVEFFDYNCTYCKSVMPGMMEVVAAEGDVRLVMKEFPILGDSSVYAARAALAAVKQGKYAAFHQTLMGMRGRIDERAVLAVAREVGLDLDRLRKDMDDPAIAEVIAENRGLAQALGISGTPAFLVGDEIIPGAVDGSVLKDKIAVARRNGKG